VFNGSVWGAASRVLTKQQVLIATEWTPLAIDPAAATLVSLLGVAIVCLVLLSGLGRANLDQTYALLALASLLASPLGWVYYLPAAFGPVAVVLARRPSRWLWPVGLLAVCPYQLLVNHHYSALATATVGQISLAVVGGFFLLVYATTRRQEAIDGRV
jgi:hypothetical protein